MNRVTVGLFTSDNRRNVLRFVAMGRTLVLTSAMMEMLLMATGVQKRVRLSKISTARKSMALILAFTWVW
jgi:hypothetical protein